MEEKRKVRKLERMERRRKLMDHQDDRRGGGEVLLAYGLNKNLKQIRERPKSAKPSKKSKRNRQEIQF